MKVSVKQVYTSVACNRIPEIVDWNSEGVVCFGASNAVVIYDMNVKNGDPLTVLCHHRSKVNSVKWLCKPDGTCSELVSCSADKSAAIWTLEDGVWKVTNSLTGHTDGITCIYGIYTSGDDLVVYTGSIDSSIRVWERENGVTTLKQIINLNSGLCLTFHAHLLPVVNKPVLFCALDDHKIHIFAGDVEYNRVHTLVGHEDWVRGLDVLDVDDTTIMVASASQDMYIRLWRVQRHVEYDRGAGIRVEEKVFPAYGQQWSVKLEAVLAGHEGWVYGVQWHPYSFDEDTKKKSPVYRLLSSSLDKTLIIWEAEGSGAGAWTERVRVGAAGGGGLGFYGSRFGPGGGAVMGHGYNGSFHVWNLNKETSQWEPAVVPGGHYSAAEDVRWEPRAGRYIMSVSADQTTRVHAPWSRPDGGVEWHEVARPQVHGYDMSSLALVSAGVFASAAEEKVVRVFRAPKTFLHNYRNIVGDALEEDTGAPAGASVPALGLSNKAVFAADDAPRDLSDDADEFFTPVALTEPPTEETLMQSTLWPETHKLYGHGYEVFALDASPDGALLASACRATAPDHAATLIWSTTTWRQIQKLVSHQLTVTQLAFSPDSRRLVSVSRDRRWTLYSRADAGGAALHEEARCGGAGAAPSPHARLLWSAAWTHDSACFATASRDGRVCVWGKVDTPTETPLGEYGLVGVVLEVGTSVTAVAWAPLAPAGGDKAGGWRLLAAGLHTGVVRLYKFQPEGWSLLHEMDKRCSEEVDFVNIKIQLKYKEETFTLPIILAAHHLTVKRLTFKPRPADDDGKEVLLASCGSDHLVRIHRVTITC